MIFLKCLLLITQMAFSATVVIPSATASKADYEAYLAAHPEWQTPAEELSNRLVPAEKRNQLIETYARAQAEFIGADPAKAVPLLEDILREINSEDWGRAERRILFQSALRRAQLADEGAKPKWLKLAITVGSDGEVDPNLFPPPLLESLAQLKKDLPKIPVRHLIPEGWDRVKVQGLSYSTKSDQLIPDTGEPVRISWISNLYQPESAVLPLQKASKAHLQAQAWVDGSCDSPRFSPTARQFSSKSAFFSLECVGRTDRPIDFRPSSPNPVELPHVARIADRPIYKSGWFWTGVGAAVVVAMIVAQRNNQKSEKEPTTTYGY